MATYPTDQLLAQALAAGDPAAGEAYVALFREPLIRFAMSRGFSFHDAEDLAQEALAEGFVQIASFTTGYLRRWLFGIEFNFMRRQWDASKSHPVAPLDDATESAASILAAQSIEGELDDEEKRKLNRLWAEVQTYMVLARGNKYTEAVRLRLDGLTYTQIEEALGLSKGSGAVYVQRGRKDLKEKYERDIPEDSG